ncbi:MAG: carboxypeptidase regulatory-like domain-containing protein [Acidobacteria bacterium]|nr:carboxypeptidase regulatory-like domain-containing protein [Acidobacteriota bacterium]
MNKIINATSLTIILAAALFGQAATSVNGTVTDPSGLPVPDVQIQLRDPQTGAIRDTTSDSQGRYALPQVKPGLYQITAKSKGFNDLIVNDVRLLVNTPATVNLTFESVGSVATVVSVSAESTQINTTDASVGNAIGEKPILELPLEARNVVGLLSIQPGVTYLGEPEPGVQSDFRSGSVNGGKADQANVTLDGVDVNDQQQRSAFTSVLRTTLDSVQEFRTITTNAGAEFGRTSGAQVSLLTRSGSNDMHGALYYFLRNTATSANSFFNNSAGVPREKLNRNLFGGRIGGPIQKNRLFYFLNYEGRRDSSEINAVRVVPNADFRNGLFHYVRKDGSIGSLGPADFKRLDPLGIGQNQAVLDLLKTYPMPNDTTSGDLLNTAGFRFNARAPLSWNTYIAKIDWTADTSGRHVFFLRGNLQNDDYTNSLGVPQFPDQPPQRKFLDNSKGLAVGYTATLTPSLISNFRYGFTRQGLDNLGSLTANFADFRDIDNRYATTSSLSRITGVHQVSEDFSWNHGAHSVAFGGVMRFIRNNRYDFGNSFSNALSNANYLLGSGREFEVADAQGGTAYRRQFVNLLGLMTQLTANYNYDLKGNLLPLGQGIRRDFASEEYEMYVQDTWRATRGLTITAGLRLSLMPPVYERNGYQTNPQVPLADWFVQRQALADSGQSQAGVAPVEFDLASRLGRDLYPYHKNWSPRLGIAYSPQGNDGWSKKLFGGPGKTSIRAGFGMFYDLFGQGIITNYSGSALGLTSQLQPPPTFSSTDAPRFTGFYNWDSSILPQAPAGGFPQVQPDNFAITNSIDEKLKAPYTMNTNFSISREFAGGLMIQGSYVGRLSRRSLINFDLAMPTNLRDPASGQTYFQAAQQLALLARSGTATANVKPIPFWENMWPGAASGTRSATQNIYSVFAGAYPDITSALTAIDLPDETGECFPSCSKLGPYSMFNSQFSSLAAARSVGKGYYHAMQWTVRKRFSTVQMDINYTLGKSIDYSSAREVASATGGQVINSWNIRQMKDVSDYDVTHLVSALGVWELPVGKGKRWISSPSRLTDNLLGGWQLSGIWRQSSGFPTGAVANGVWPTNWNVTSFASQTGFVPKTGTAKNAPAAIDGAAGGPNMFADPATAIAGYDYALPGESGQRNGLRGDGFFTIDLGMSKRFTLFTHRDIPHTLQFRAEAFNVTNTVRFDVATSNTDINDPGSFGKYTSQFGSPRVFQFALRYEF